MITVEQYAQEIFWLKRRIKLLERLDDILNDDYDEIDEKQKKVDLYAKLYDKVRNPKDLVNRLREIYGKEIK